MRILGNILAVVVAGLAGAAVVVITAHLWGVQPASYTNSFDANYLMWGGGLLTAYIVASLLKWRHHQ